MSIDWEAVAREVTRKVEQGPYSADVRQLAKDVGEAMDAARWPETWTPPPDCITGVPEGAEPPRPEDPGSPA